MLEDSDSDSDDSRVRQVFLDVAFHEPSTRYSAQKEAKLSLYKTLYQARDTKAFAKLEIQKQPQKKYSY